MKTSGTDFESDGFDFNRFDCALLSVPAEEGRISISGPARCIGLP
ncbi:hypothetical protein [Roseobacter sp.]